VAEGNQMRDRQLHRGVLVGRHERRLHPGQPAVHEHHRQPAIHQRLVAGVVGAGVRVQAGDEGIRFLLVSGKPIEEPVAWYGPIVMNTEAQLQQAYAELRDGSFIKSRGSEWAKDRERV